MSVHRRAFARPVPSFGRRYCVAAAPAAEPAQRIGDDLRLFALTFAGGFLFMSVILA